MTSQEITELIKFILPIVSTMFTAWIALQQSRVRHDVSANTAMTQEVKNDVRSAAVSAAVVEAKLDVTQEATHRKLDQISDVGIITKKLVNGNIQKKLQIIASQAQKIAELHASPENLASAEKAKKELDDHERQEEEADKASR